MRELRRLAEEIYRGYPILIEYTTEEYYDVAVERTEDGFDVRLAKRRFAAPVTHTPEEYDVPDRLYAPHWDGADAYGMFEDGELIGAIELWTEDWSKRLRVTELWVAEAHRNRGVGKALMQLAKDRMRERGLRAVMLETQSCNVSAIGFYLHEGFTLIGFDSCCYSNRDLERKEVRLELGYFGDGGEW